ncbi:hypothetical protein FOE78_01805 [Microlunatus elymi]|uniref:Uncharacterized protein n=1 Tax=Microlunatus elymi TaxID=2596828 RepID=A0A516PUJ2_9ACTN|nr:hypothetical protein [Microlunatus elymi]QDP94822.1 hypothetical protein FOE78_01805 [Microlunatus elymi]
MTAREFAGADPFVSIDVAPEVTLMCRDPDALLAFEREVRHARQRLTALLEAAMTEFEVVSDLLEVDADGDEIGSESTGRDAWTPPGRIHSGVSGRF